MQHPRRQRVDGGSVSHRMFAFPPRNVWTLTSFTANKLDLWLVYASTFWVEVSCATTSPLTKFGCDNSGEVLATLVVSEAKYVVMYPSPVTEDITHFGFNDTSIEGYTMNRIDDDILTLIQPVYRSFQRCLSERQQRNFLCLRGLLGPVLRPQ